MPTFGWAPVLALKQRATGLTGTIEPLVPVAPFLAIRIGKPWSIEVERRKGLTTARMTLVTSDVANWAAVEAYLEPGNLVYLSLRYPPSGITSIGMGTIDRMGDPKGMPANRLVRELSIDGIWNQLDKPGITVLALYENMTIQNIVKALVADFAADTDISSATTQVTAGGSYSIPQAFYEDMKASDVIQKLAETNGDTVFGITSNGLLYFKPETSPLAAAAWTVTLGSVWRGATVGANTPVDGGVEGYSQRREFGDRVNSYLIEGREAQSGNAMTVCVENIAANDWKRSKTIRAPELVIGANLVRWGTFLIAKDEDPTTEGELGLLGGYPPGPITTPPMATDLNANLKVQDELAAEIGTYPVRSLKYESIGGTARMTFGLGTRPRRDVVDEMGMRDLLRDVAVFESKELSNAVELASAQSDWMRDAYLQLAGRNKMRNTWRATLDKPDVVLEGVINKKLPDHLMRSQDSDGIMMRRASKGVANMAYVQTLPVNTGMTYTQFAVMRNIRFPQLLAGVQDAGGSQMMLAEDTAMPFVGGVTWAHDPTYAHWEACPMLGVFHPGAMWLHKRRCSFAADLVFDFYWRRPYPDPAQADIQRDYLIFYYYDRDNYHFLRFYRPNTATIWKTRMYWILGKVEGGAPNYDTGYSGYFDFPAGTWYRPHVQIRIQPRQTTDAIPLPYYRIKLNALGNHPSSVLPDPTPDQRYYDTPTYWLNIIGGVCGFGHQLMATGTGIVPGDGVWCNDITFEHPTFLSGMEGGEWQISRDGMATWEGTLNPDTGAPQTLGVNPSDNEAIIVRGKVIYPQVLTHVALGWK